MPFFIDGNRFGVKEHPQMTILSRNRLLSQAELTMICQRTSNEQTEELLSRRPVLSKALIR